MQLKQGWGKPSNLNLHAHNVLNPHSVLVFKVDLGQAGGVRRRKRSQRLSSDARVKFRIHKSQAWTSLRSGGVEFKGLEYSVPRQLQTRAQDAVNLLSGQVQTSATTGTMWCSCACLCVYAYLYIYIYVRLSVCLSVCMYVCMYVSAVSVASKVIIQAAGTRTTKTTTIITAATVR